MNLLANNPILALILYLACCQIIPLALAFSLGRWGSKYRIRLEQRPEEERIEV